YVWNTIATSRAAGSRRVTSRSPIRISPALGSSSPAMQRSTVVFPQPDGPSSTKNSPSCTSSDMSSSAGRPSGSYRLARRRRVTDATEVLIPGRQLELDRHLEPHAHRAPRDATRGKARRPDVVLRRLIESRVAALDHAHRFVFDSAGRVDHGTDDDAPADPGEEQGRGVGERRPCGQVGSLLHLAFAVHVAG